MMMRLVPLISGITVGCIMAVTSFYQVTFRSRASSDSQNLDFGKNGIGSYGIVKREKTSSDLSVLCIVTLKSKSVRNLIAVNDTYVKRCNRTVYYANSKPKPKLKAINHPGPRGPRDRTIVKSGPLSENSKLEDIPVKIISKNDGKIGTWAFLRSTLRDLSTAVDEDYDWILIADDKIFVILENLKHFVSDLNPNTAIFAGNKIDQRSKFLSTFLLFLLPADTVYFRSDSGYLLSRKLFEILTALLVEERCKPTELFHEEQLGFYNCMMQLSDIELVDGEDTFGGQRFLPHSPKKLISLLNEKENLVLNEKETLSSFWSFFGFKDEEKNGKSFGCSDRAITFGNLNHKEFRMLEYILYRLKLFGVNQLMK